MANTANIQDTDNSSGSISETLSAPEPESTSLSQEAPPPAEGETLSPLYTPSPLSISFAGYMTDRFGEIRTIGKVDPISRSTVKVGDLTLTVKDNTASKIGIGEDKILQTAIQAFTALNGKNKKSPNLRVIMSYSAFEKLNGIETEPRHMSTPEEQEKENQRIDDMRDNFYKKVRRNLRNIRKCIGNWNEKVNNKLVNAGEQMIISGWSVRRKPDTILIDFAYGFAEYLVQLPLSYYPAALLRVDERNPNAYALGRAMARHCAIDNNIMRGTEQRLTVPTLLKHTNLPPIEKIRAQRKGWERAIKEPFENALDELTRAGVLISWRYCLPKGAMLTDEQAYSIDSYEKFASLLIHYKIAGYESHEIRYQKELEKRQKRQEAAAEDGSEKKKKGSSKKKSTSDKSTSKKRKPSS